MRNSAGSASDWSSVANVRNGFTKSAPSRVVDPARSENQDRGVAKPRRMKRREAVGEVVRDDEVPVVEWVEEIETSLDEGPVEPYAAGRRSLEGRDDEVDVGERGARGFQARANREAIREALLPVGLGARDPLLLDRGDQPPVTNEGARRVMSVMDPEDDGHRAHAPFGWKPKVRIATDSPGFIRSRP